MTSTGEAGVDRKRAELLEQLLRQRRLAKADQDRIDVVPREETAALAPQQEGLWLAAEVRPDETNYHIVVAMRLTGPLDVGLLRRAATELTARHESLRTGFVTLDGVPRLVVEPPPGTISLEQVDLTDLPEPIRLDRGLRLAVEHGEQVLGLRHAPLLRIWLARLGEQDYLLELLMHHIIGDGWSMPILARDLSELYNAAQAGRAAQLPTLSIQPIDVYTWQRNRLTGEQGRQRLAYWQNQLAGMPHLRIPTDRPRPAQPSYVGRTVSVPLPTELVDRADAEAATSGQMPFAVLLAAFAILLQQRSGQHDLAIGSVFSGRVRTEMEQLIGFFANTAVLRVRLAEDQPLSALIGHCHELLLDAQRMQDVPFTEVVSAVQPERVPGANPLFQICFAVARGPVRVAPLALDGMAVEEFTVLPRGSRFDLTFQVTQQPDGEYAMQVEYASALFDEPTVRRLAVDFRELLTRMLPATGLAELTVDELLQACDLAAQPAERARPDEPAPPVEPAQPGERARSGESAARLADRTEPAGVPLEDDQADGTHLLDDELAAIWSEVFNVPAGQYSYDQSFFEVGGTSIQAVRLRTRIESNFGVDIELADIFAGGSVAELAASVEAALAGGDAGLWEESNDDS
jgi:acyl carrier protein